MICATTLILIDTFAVLLVNLTSLTPCLAFTTRTGTHGVPRRSSIRSAATEHGSGTPPALSPPPEIVATCKPLGGSIYQLPTQRRHCGAPVFACKTTGNNILDDRRLEKDASTRRLGLEGVVPGAFLVQQALSADDCEAIIQSCENEMEFSSLESSESIVQVMVSDQAATELSRRVSRHVNLDVLFDLPGPPQHVKSEDNDIRFTMAGVNKYWRVHKYDNQICGLASMPHVHVGQAPARLSDDGSKIVWDAHSKDQEIQSRFIVIVYLNDDFVGGHEQFFRPRSEQQGQDMELLTSIKPRAGSALVFPQASNDLESVHYAQNHWPTYASLPITGGNRAKYVLRTDILVATSDGLAEEDKGNPLFQYDALVRDAFLPRSHIVDKCIASQLASLYNPHMGVENAGPLLYAMVRFAKPRKLVEIGAGYTTIWLLQALKDNDSEMHRIANLQKQGKCRLLDYPWSIEEYVNEYMKERSSLLCIDNCLHQRETATGAAAVAANLGLDSYFHFIQGDAYDMQFEKESIDLLWCDFGVGHRMRDFARGAWKSIRPGGFLVCHSTLTNQGTREWLEDVRAGRDETVTGIPPDEVVELSLLEPTKRYQNSLTILQRRKSSQSGNEFVEPIYSLYA